MKLRTINLNDKANVKLTNKGRLIHRLESEALLGNLPSWKYEPRKEDSKGWSEWQLWELFEMFGKHIHMGFDQPFEMTIQVEVK